jgi:hypothetical protein
MPRVDSNAPLATNSDAAMWRRDHASACRYIETLLVEREESMAVVEAAKEYATAYRAYHAAPRLERFAREVDLTRAGIALDAEAAAYGAPDKKEETP